MTTNTDDESRDAFEQYIAAQTGYPMEFIKGQRASKGNGYYNEFLDIPWRTWKASREALKASKDIV